MNDTTLQMNIKRTFKIIISFVLLLLIGCDNDPTEPENQLPRLDSIYAKPEIVIHGDTTRLFCLVSDFENDDLTYEWSSEVGSFIEDTDDYQVLWKAPDSIGIFPIEVTISDGHNSITEYLLVEVDPGLSCPEAIVVRYMGKVYKTVKIGDQCWFRVNLDVGEMIHNHINMSNNNVLEKYCYDNDPSNCEKYGGLYQWKEAMQYTVTDGSQGICPDGWHIPTKAEFEILEDYVNDQATKLISENILSAYTYTNETGFSILFTGSRHFSSYFLGLDRSTYFWSSTEKPRYVSAYGMHLHYINKAVYIQDFGNSGGFCIRCIKDKE